MQENNRKRWVDGGWSRIEVIVNGLKKNKSEKHLGMEEENQW